MKASKTMFAMVTLTLAACGNDFDPQSAIVGVRVLGVKVETPYVKPGTKPKLDMLVVDRERRAISVVWMHGCKNPKGDIFHQCYPELSRRLGEAYGGKRAPMNEEIAGLVTLGPSTTTEIPADTISSRPPTPQGSSPQGRAFVFFAACAGEVRYDPARTGTDSSGLPIRCVRPGTDEDLGDGDFVFGNTPLFVFAELQHQHPVIEGIAWDGGPLLQGGCDAGCAPGYACGSKNRCLPVVDRCTASAEGDCRTKGWKPVVSRASAEPDPVASALDKTPTLESIYVQYASTNGRFENGAKVVNDPTKGWNESYDGQFRAFKASPGESTLYAVVRDNRGGQTWSSFDVIIR